MVNKKVQKSGKKSGEKESTSEKTKKTKSMDLYAEDIDNQAYAQGRKSSFEVMDEILKIKDQIITVKEDMIQISDSIRNRLEKLETRIGIPR